MSEKIKAAPGVASTENGKGQLIMTDFTPETDVITDFQAKQESIAYLLSKGQENARTCNQLAKMTGLPKRSITLAICKERREGAPIMSGGSGFWLAQDRDEMLRCIKRLHKRAGEIHKTARALEKML